MKRSRSFGLLIALFCAVLIENACAAPAAAPTSNVPFSVAIAATATSLPPTDTPPPPTDTLIRPTETLVPTETEVPPTATPTVTPTATPTITPTNTRTVTRIPLPRATSTPLPLLNWFVDYSLRGSGLFYVTNRYPGPLTLTINKVPYTVPAGASQFPIKLAPGDYTFSAVIPGIGQQPEVFFTVFTITPNADLTLIFAK
jgi:hypothetical protein